MALFTSRKQGQELKVSFNNELLLIKFADGKEVAYPLGWHPALLKASEEERNKWKISSDFSEISWDDLNVHIQL